jgi:hypothetical protein
LGRSDLCTINIYKHRVGRSSIKIAHFILIGQKTWSPWAILVSDWLKHKKSSPLKLGGTINCYFVGIMYGRSCTKFPYFMPSDWVDLIFAQLIFTNTEYIVCYALTLWNFIQNLPINASYQISINLAKWFRELFFLISQSQPRTAHISCGWSIYKNLPWNRLAKWIETW